MLMEEGRIRLSDPVSKSIPEFHAINVAVMQERQSGGPGAPPSFYTIPATREIAIQDRFRMSPPWPHAA